MGCLSNGGGGGNRTPVRKRFNRNFSGRRRLFAFPRPDASRHAPELGSFMIHGALKALRTHGHHLSTPHPGPWSSRVRRSLLRQREEQCYRCSLIYKLPILWMVGASARYSCLHTPVETSTPPRQKKLASLGFELAKGKMSTLFSASAVIQWLQKRIGRAYSLTGSGYSTPKVSTVTFFITCGVRGLSL